LCAKRPALHGRGGRKVSDKSYGRVGGDGTGLLLSGTTDRQQAGFRTLFIGRGGDPISGLEVRGGLTKDRGHGGFEGQLQGVGCASPGSAGGRTLTAIIRKIPPHRACEGFFSSRDALAGTARFCGLSGARGLFPIECVITEVISWARMEGNTRSMANSDGEKMPAPGLAKKARKLEPAILSPGPTGPKTGPDGERHDRAHAAKFTPADGVGGGTCAKDGRRIGTARFSIADRARQNQRGTMAYFIDDNQISRFRPRWRWTHS